MRLWALLTAAALGLLSGGLHGIASAADSCDLATRKAINRLKYELAMPSAAKYRPIPGAPGGTMTLGEAKVFEAVQASVSPAYPAISAEEVVALSRNHYPDVTLDGSTGLFVKGGQLEVDATRKLVGAYRSVKGKLAQRSTGRSLPTLEASDIIELRTRAMDQGLWRDPSRVVNLGRDLPLSPYVESRMRNMGFKIKRDTRGILVDASGVDFKKQLDALVDRINQRILAGEDPDFITAYASHELAILQPFNDGNGRTARLLGQLLDESLTGKVRVYPSGFHKELELNVTELSNQLKRTEGKVVPAAFKDSRIEPPVYEVGKPLGPSPPSVLKTRPNYDSVKWTEEFSSQASEPSREWTLQLPNSNGDHWQRSGPRTIRVPADATRFNGDVFFGKALGTAEEVERDVATAFTYGRSIPEGTAVGKNLSAHVAGGSGIRGNGFMQTTRDAQTAVAFSRGKAGGRQGNFGVVYRIDARGAEVLDLKKVSRLLTDDPLHGELPYAGHALKDMRTEEEVVFPGLISPDRIRAAEVIEYNASGGPIAVRVITNPGYRPR